MQRFPTPTILGLALCVLSTSFLGAQVAKKKSVEKPIDDNVTAQVSALEAELAKYNDTAPEAADVMVKLTSLYHQHGRIFGLLRIGQRFVAAHPNDKRHPAVMLQLIDGLEVSSRNKELTAACRQFLTRYPKAPQCAEIEVRLAEALHQLSDRVATADADAAVFRRQPTTLTGRQHAVRAIRTYSSINNKNIFTKAAVVAEELFDKLPVGISAADAGWQAVSQWRRAAEYAKSNLAGRKMLARGLPQEKPSRRELHRTMAENFGSLGQYANAVNSLKQARALGDHYTLHYQQIVRLNQSNVMPNELAPVVADYVRKYPDRDDRWIAESYLALAYIRAKDNDRAVALLGKMLPHDAISNSSARNYVAYSKNDPATNAKVAAALLGAINKNPDHAYYLRYVLAFNVYRDRLKDEAKTRQTLLDLITKSPSNDGHTSGAINWLLSSAKTDDVFRADLNAILTSAKKNPNLTILHTTPAAWGKQHRRHKTLKQRAAIAQQEAQKTRTDPAIVTWALASNLRKKGGPEARAQLLKPASFNAMSDTMARSLLEWQGRFYWSYGGNKQRVNAAPIYGMMARRFPEDFLAATYYLQTATDYNTPEIRKQAALHMLSLEPPSNNADIWRRLMISADSNKDPALARRALAWILKSQQKYGKEPTYASYIGDTLAKYKMEAEAVKYWTTYVSFDRNHYESRECASRLLARMKTDDKDDVAAQTRFVQELIKHDTDFHGRYAEWLAGYQFTAGNLDAFEKTLRTARKRQDERLFRSWDFNEYVGQNWTNAYRNSKEKTDAEKRRVFTIVRDLKLLRASGTAQLALLEITPPGAMPEIERLRLWQKATRMVGDASHDWDRLMPHVQAAMSRKDFAAASTLLTGMLSNIPNADAGRKKTGRELVAQSYSRMGGVGLTIDENSPIAPLLRAALYLRLGDQRLAMEAYSAHKSLFDKHRNQVPVDLLLFVCENYIAAGGDKNHDYAEDALRGWMVKNSESKAIEEETKARVQLLLARNFFKASRYDIARTEFTTVINRYANTPQAVEARFGIGETYMAQKVYDQAEAVFEKLAGSRDADVMIRAEFLRGVLTYRRGDKDDARAIFRAVLERVPNIELANRALFNLAEVYGDEEKYIDQLNLLRTVGRLGRASKRRHRPGTPLSIVVQDSDLGISRGHNKIPVRVTTEPGGDSELIYLTSGGAGKGLFRAELETRLGQVTKDDKVLQLSGNDVIKCDYPKQFKTEFKHVSLSDVEIRIAADAEFKIASSKIVDEKQETFSEQLRKQSAREANGDQRVSQTRPANQIKPGNIIYLRVVDPDRDLKDDADTIVAKLVADSGDQVQVELTETGPHTGLFEGTVQTGELPAGALASDTAIEHSPLMAIDRDPKSFWLSEPDGETPKTLTIDMKDLKSVSRVRLTTPDEKKQSPQRGRLLGSNDGRFWFRLASNPPLPEAPPIAETFGQMTGRVFDGNFTRYTTWNQVVALAKSKNAIATLENVEALEWSRPEDEERRPRAYGVIWHGKLVQEQTGAARLHIRATRAAIVVDGRLELPVGPGNTSVDLWLERGVHELTIFAASASGTQPVTATIARADHRDADVVLAPFRKSDFDLAQPAAKVVPDTKSKIKTPVTVEGPTWAFQVKPIKLRYVRFVIDEYLGEAVAISHMEISGDDAEKPYIPTESDVLALANNNVLEIAGGDVVTATYADERTQSNNGQSRLLTARLTATYHNAQVAPIAYDLRKLNNGAVEETRKELMRIDPGERIVFEIVDFDRDRTAQRDTVTFEVTVNDGKPKTFTATETDQYTGIFTKEIDTSAKPGAETLQVKPGDRIYCRYLDTQNTFPGHAVPRESVVYVNEPSIAKIRLFESRVIPPPENSTARPRYDYRYPKEGQDVSRIAFEAPLTVEVIDPDAAKDSLSKITVTLLTSEGVRVDVECVVSPAFSRRPRTKDNWPLREGRFVGQVILQLGGKNSQHIVPLSLNMPRNLIGGPATGDEKDSGFDSSLTAHVLNVTGKDRINAVYIDQLRPDGKKANVTATGRLITNGTLTGTDRDYNKPVRQLHVGEKLFLLVSDADRDASDQRDTVNVEITTERGEKETVTLKETLAHSGVFVGSFPLKPSEKPTPGNLQPEQPAIETYFGDTVRLKYVDPSASSDSGTLDVETEIPVVIGTDGLVSAFSKTFNNEKLAVETKFHIAESYFELFKSHKKLGRKSEQKTDLQAGRRVLKEVIEDFPDPKYVPRISYLLGQFAQELEQWPEAIESYELIIRQYADHTLAPDAQYKLAQCYEEAGDFDQALEAYVTLAATYPKSPLIADVMLRISDYFFKNKKYDIAAQVGEKFLERFEAHKNAPVMAFQIGQCYFKSEKYKESAAAFDRFAKEFPDNKLSSMALFWSGESLRLAKNNREAFVRFNNCRWKFPASEAAKYARGRLALPEMIRQFEAEARSVDDDN